MKFVLLLKDYNWLIFPVNLQLDMLTVMVQFYYNWLIFPVNLQQQRQDGGF